jgi:hypothetical protein
MALKKVCDLMEKDRVPITLAEAVRRTGEEGPKYTTVCNQGSLLGEYVRTRIDEQVATLPKSRFEEHQTVSDQLRDPVLQARVRDLENTSRYMKRENTALRSLFKSLRPGVDIDGMLSGPKVVNLEEVTNGEVLQEKTSWGPEICKTILKLIDHLIRERQYQIYRGRLAINKKTVLSPEDLSVIRIALGISESEWIARYSSTE